MTDTLPPPPVPAEVDLRDFDFMPLRVERLLASDTWIMASGDEAKAAVTLWCRAWHQVPAGSLPDDDRLLAALSGAGGRWKRIRETALRGFAKASDGRLYHTAIAKEAVDAWERKLAQKARVRAAIEARKNGGKKNATDTATQTVTVPPTSPPEPTVTVDLTLTQGQGQRQGQGQGPKEEGSVPSERTRGASSPAAPVVPLAGPSESEGPGLPLTEPAELPPVPLRAVRPEGDDWRKALYRQGLDYLARATGKKPDRMRGFLGAQLKALQDDPRAVFEILAEAEQREVAEPVAWITRAVATRAGSSGQQQAVADDKALMERIDKAMTRA